MAENGEIVVYEGANDDESSEKSKEHGKGRGKGKSKGHKKGKGKGKKKNGRKGKGSREVGRGKNSRGMVSKKQIEETERWSKKGSKTWGSSKKNKNERRSRTPRFAYERFDYKRNRGSNQDRRGGYGNSWWGKSGSWETKRGWGKNDDRSRNGWGWWSRERKSSSEDQFDYGSYEGFDNYGSEERSNSASSEEDSGSQQVSDQCPGGFTKSEQSDGSYVCCTNQAPGRLAKVIRSF